jgi:hypothetical protein
MALPMAGSMYFSSRIRAVARTVSSMMRRSTGCARSATLRMFSSVARARVLVPRNSRRLRRDPPLAPGLLWRNPLRTPFVRRHRHLGGLHLLPLLERIAGFRTIQSSGVSPSRTSSAAP